MKTTLVICIFVVALSVTVPREASALKYGASNSARCFACAALGFVLGRAIAKEKKP